MKGFTTLDYVLVVGYLLTIAAIGSSFYKRKSTAKDYFLGGRSMSWLPVGISLVAADLSAITLMGPIVIKVFVPFYSRLNLYTAYEYLERRFSLPVRLLTSVLFQVLRGAHVAIVIYAPSLVINL